MNVARETTNKALVIVALDTPFNKRDYCIATDHETSRDARPNTFVQFR
jgi:hypothetical protein